MKTIALAILTGAAALVANSAHAQNRVLVSGHIEFGTRIPSQVYVAPAPVYVAPATPVYYGAPAPAACPPVAQVHYVEPRGFWREVTVRTWVPERSVISYNRWGHAERVCEPAHYELRNERVWVDHDRRDEGRGYGSSGSYGSSYGFGYDHHDDGGHEYAGGNRR